MNDLNKEALYTKGDIIKLKERYNSSNKAPYVVCGLAYKGEYTLMFLQDYIEYMAKEVKKFEEVRKRRLSVHYVDNHSDYLGTEIEVIGVLYD